MAIRLIEGHVRELGGFQVSRVLPAELVRHVGPFVFFDHMGPVDFPPGQGVAVRPHPHIGLATITYLFEGAMMHRDSIGSVQQIVPGDVNWMSAGQGVVHSERSPDSLRAAGHRVHGLQAWVALDLSEEDDAPRFEHQPGARLPQVRLGGAHIRLLVGEAFGLRAATHPRLPMFYAHADLEADAELAFPAEYVERAVYPVDAPICIGGHEVAAGTLAVIDSANTEVVCARSKATLMLLGGAPLAQPRYLSWNFVSSSKQRIDAARASWRAYPNAQFPAVPGETEWIPLPA